MIDWVSDYFRYNQFGQLFMFLFKAEMAYVRANLFLSHTERSFASSSLSFKIQNAYPVWNAANCLKKKALNRILIPFHRKQMHLCLNGTETVGDWLLLLQTMCQNAKHPPNQRVTFSKRVYCWTYCVCADIFEATCFPPKLIPTARESWKERCIFQEWIYLTRSFHSSLIKIEKWHFLGDRKKLIQKSTKIFK